MAYLNETLTGTKAKELATRSFCGLGLAPSDPFVQTIAKVEIWSSSFEDPGEDWNEYRAFDSTGNLVMKSRSQGF